MHHVLISGASIAGPALALLLSRYGFQVTVVERAPALRPGGYAVDIRGSALGVVQHLGLREKVRPLETDTLSNAVVDARGRIFGRMERGFGVIDPGDIEIHRGDLARLLHDESRDSVTYRFGDSVATLVQSATGVEVAFESGAKGTYDLVVGADGVHSRTRALVFGPESELVRPLGSAMAIFTVPNHLGLVREQLLFSALNRIASIKCDRDGSTLKVCVFFKVAGAVDRLPAPEQRALVRAAFLDAGWEFPRLLDAMDEADDFYFDVTCQVRMPSYVRGRVVLLGDAACCPSPLSGQGTSLALVGAWELSRALLEHPLDLQQALARYDDRMRPFAVRNQDVALDIARQFAPVTPFQVWMRNAAMRVLPYIPGTGAIMKLAMKGVRDAARALPLSPA